MEIDGEDHTNPNITHELEAILVCMHQLVKIHQFERCVLSCASLGDRMLIDTIVSCWCVILQGFRKETLSCR